MLGMEVSGNMKTGTNERTRIQRQHEADWLNRLLADVRQEVGSQPSPQAIARVRARLLAHIKTPAKAAA